MTQVNPFISGTDTVELFGLSWLCPDKDRRWRLWWLGDIILTHPGGSLARPGQVTSQCWVHVRAAVPRLEDLVTRQVILLLLQRQQQQLQVFEVKGQEFDREGLFRQCIYVLYMAKCTRKMTNRQHNHYAVPLTWHCAKCPVRGAGWQGRRPMDTAIEFTGQSQTWPHQRTRDDQPSKAH